MKTPKNSKIRWKLCSCASREMCDLYFEGEWKWKLHCLQVLWFFLAAVSPPTGKPSFINKSSWIPGRPKPQGSLLWFTSHEVHGVEQNCLLKILVTPNNQHLKMSVYCIECWHAICVNIYKMLNSHSEEWWNYSLPPQFLTQSHRKK